MEHQITRISTLVLLFLLIGQTALRAQENTLSKSFYDTRVVNGHSVETNKEGVMKFIIAHRFGRVNGGAYELWGLDQSTIRLGFDYGISDRFTIGIGRSSFEKTLDGFAKFRLMQQSNGEKQKPVSLTALATISRFGLKVNNDPIFESKHRMNYAYQLLIARQLSPRMSVQLMPSLVHRNLVTTTAEKNDAFALGSAARWEASKRFTFSFEHYLVLPDQLADDFHNSFALGVNFETKGHVFQFHFGNSRGMTEKFFIAETTGKWGDGDVHFGFNITRDFKIKGRKY